MRSGVIAVGLAIAILGGVIWASAFYTIESIRNQLCASCGGIAALAQAESYVGLAVAAGGGLLALAGFAMKAPRRGERSHSRRSFFPQRRR